MELTKILTSNFAHSYYIKAHVKWPDNSKTYFKACFHQPNSDFWGLQQKLDLDLAIDNA